MVVFTQGKGVWSDTLPVPRRTSEAFPLLRPPGRETDRGHGPRSTGTNLARPNPDRPRGPGRPDPRDRLTGCRDPRPPDPVWEDRKGPELFEIPVSLRLNLTGTQSYDSTLRLASTVSETRSGMTRVRRARVNSREREVTLGSTFGSQTGEVSGRGEKTNQKGNGSLPEVSLYPPLRVRP